VLGEVTHQTADEGHRAIALHREGAGEQPEFPAPNDYLGREDALRDEYWMIGYGKCPIGYPRAKADVVNGDICPTCGRKLGYCPDCAVGVPGLGRVPVHCCIRQRQGRVGAVFVEIVETEDGQPGSPGYIGLAGPRWTGKKNNSGKLDTHSA